MIPLISDLLVQLFPLVVFGVCWWPCCGTSTEDCCATSNNDLCWDASEACSLPSNVDITFPARDSSAPTGCNSFGNFTFCNPIDGTTVRLPLEISTRDSASCSRTAVYRDTNLATCSLNPTLKLEARANLTANFATGDYVLFVTVGHSSVFASWELTVSAGDLHCAAIEGSSISRKVAGDGRCHSASQSPVTIALIP
jgi:hypothetical protein